MNLPELFFTKERVKLLKLIMYGQYSISFFVIRKEAETAFKIAREFVERMNKLLNSFEAKD